MQQEQKEQKGRLPELPEEAYELALQASLADARYIQKQDMTALTMYAQYGGKTYRVQKKLWANRGNSLRDSDRPLVAMCSGEGLDYDTLARSAPERLALNRRSYTLTMTVHRTQSGNPWVEILSFSVSEAGKERSKEQILEDLTFRLNQQISDMELNLVRVAETQQKAESECRKLRRAYEELTMEYRSVVFERDELRRRLGMGPGKSVLPENLVDISSGLPDSPRRRFRKEQEDELVQGDEILQAFLTGQI